MKENVLKVIALLLLLIINDIGVIGTLQYVSSPETGSSVSSRPEGTFKDITNDLTNAETDNSGKKAANRADGQQHQMKGQCPSERRERNNKRNNERDRREQFAISEIKELTAKNLSEDVIISQIRSTQSSYTLSTADLISLKQAKVGDRVIECMIKTSD